MELSRIIEKVDKTFSESVWIGKVNVDNEIKTANELEVLNIPTIVIYKAGVEQERIPGGVTYEYLSKKLKQYGLKKRTKDENKKGR